MIQIKKKAFSVDEAIISSFHDSRYLVPFHIHQMAELVYVLDGNLTVSTPGKNEIAKKGDIAILQPFQPHRYYTKEGENVKLWMILFTNSLANDMYHEGSNKYEYEKAVFTPSDSLKHFINDRMIDTSEEKVVLDQQLRRKIKATLFPIIDEYNDKVSIVSESKKLRADSISVVLHYISEHYLEDINLESVANEIGYSRSHISHSLSKVLSLSFKDVLNMFRCEHAKRLILTTDKNIYLICLESGFKSERTFHRVFYNSLGCTPLHYKNTRSAFSRKQT